MKQPFQIALLIGGFMSQTVLSLDRFFLDQCECPVGSFASIEGSEASTFTVNGEIDCPTTAELGFVRDFTSQVVTSVSGNLAPTLFNDNTPARTTWVSVFDLDLNNLADNQEIGLVSLLGIDVTLVAASGIISVNIDGVFVVFSDIVTPGITRIALGEFANAVVTGVFVCIGPVTGFADCNDFGTQQVANGFVLGAINANVPVSLVASGSAGSMRVQAMGFAEASITAASVAQVDAAVAGIDLTAAALPVFNGQTVEAFEDIDLSNVNLNAFLEGSTAVTFISDDPLEITGFGTLQGFTASTGIYTLFDVVLNAFGNATFSFDYTYAVAQPFQCTLTVDEAVIDMKQVEDIPTLIVVDDVQTVAFVDVEAAVTVAVSIDFPDELGEEGTLLEGFVHIASLPTKGTLFETGCSNELEISDSVALNAAGEFEFCYQGNGDNVAGASDSFTYTVRPGSDDVENEAVGTGTITLLGGNPVVPNANVNTRSAQVDEDSADNEIVIGADNFATLDPSLNNFAFQIQVTSLPTIGTLQTTGNVDVEVDDILNVGDSLFFTPNADFFNANADAAATNDAGLDIFGVGCEEGEKVNGVCPNTFEYKVLFGNPAVESAVETFALIVRAQDDENAVILVQDEEPIIANSNNARNGFITVSGTALQVSSDNGGNVFNIGIRFVGIGGVLMELPFSELGDPTSFRLDSGSPDGNCIDDGCSIMHLIGTPTQLNGFLSQIEFEVPEVEQNGAPPKVDIFLSTEDNNIALQTDVQSYVDTDVSIEFNVEQINEGFFDDPTNVAYVAGGGGGFCLIVLIVLIVKATTVNSVDGQKVTRLSEAGPKKFKARGGVAASKQPIKKKRSFEDDEEEDEENPPPKKAVKSDPLLDWEKHIDPKTKEPFYHNPQTGETVWELPEA